MLEVTPNDEIWLSLEKKPNLREVMLKHISKDPIPNNVTEGNNRCDKFRNILIDLTMGRLNFQEAINETKNKLSPDSSVYKNDNRVFPPDWAERFVHKQFRRFYKQAVRNVVKQQFSNLIDGNPSEEEVHRFIKEYPSVIERLHYWGARSRISGTLSKFPITTDRIPDFTLVNVQLGIMSQIPSMITFIELKKPGTRLYVEHGRMSKELNDAWIESIESMRLIGPNYLDYVRRLLKKVSPQDVSSFEERRYEARGNTRHASYFLPICESVIVIGRRSSLDREDLLRTQELSISTNRRIRVVTYDALLDFLKDGYPTYRI